MLRRPTRSATRKLSFFSKPNCKENKSEVTFKEFEKYYDDSSADEAVINQHISQYDINEQWEEHEDNEDPIKTKANREEKLLSFVAHAAGIKSIYGNSKHYYELKQKLLSESKLSATEQLRTLMKTAIMDSAHFALDQVEVFLNHTKDECALQNFNECKQTCLEKFIQKLDSYLESSLTILFKWLKIVKNGSFNDVILEVRAFEKELDEFFAEAFNDFIKQYKTKESRAATLQAILDQASEEISTLSQNFGLDKLMNVPGKSQALKTLTEAKSSFPQLQTLIKRALEGGASRGYMHTVLQHELKNKFSDSAITRAYIEDLIQHKKTKTIKPPQQKWLTQYFSVSEESLYDELHFGFIKQLHHSIKGALLGFTRPTLDKSYTFVSNNPHSFHDNLRLANCDRRRTMANSQSRVIKFDNAASRVWRLNPNMPAAADVLETQFVLKSMGRRDKIEDVGNYVAVYDDLCLIQEFFRKKNENLTDAELAKWLRMIFQGNIPEFKATPAERTNILHKLQAITYLLFGCEATRNPAMHVINHMLLDLIIDNPNWTFEEALVGKKNQQMVDPDLVKKMPMVPEGAVAVSRSLLSSYRSYMPYPYFYPGIEDRDSNHDFDKAELIRLEARVVKAWLHLKKFTGSKHLKPAELFKFIETHFDRWFQPEVEASLSQDFSKKLSIR